MKKTLTLVLILGLTTVVSAQLLTRTQRCEVKNGYYDKRFVINLDTMLQVQFISVCFNCWFEQETINIFNIGDGLVWQWVDETLKPIKTKDYVDGLNQFSKLNWVMQMPVFRSPHADWLFKRK